MDLRNQTTTTNRSTRLPADAQDSGDLADIEISVKPQKNTPTFLTKLYNMVSDRNSNHLIKWSDDGNSFIVLNQDQFSHEILPRYFKHGNFSSFVRQLNMYGFHKVPHLLQGKASEGEQWEFSHENFVKNRIDLLPLFKRTGVKQRSQNQLIVPADSSPSIDALLANVSQITDSPMISNQSLNIQPSVIGGSTTSNRSTNQLLSSLAASHNWPVGDVASVLGELSAIRQTQQSITQELNSLRQENQMLWHETFEQQKKHQEQQETVEKILRFLASVFTKDKTKVINQHGSSTTASQQSSSALTSSSGAGRKRRKMLTEVNGSSNPTVSFESSHGISELPISINSTSNDNSGVLIQRPPPLILPNNNLNSFDQPVGTKRILTPSPGPLVASDNARDQLEQNINQLQGNIDSLTASLGLKSSDVSNLDQMDVDDFLANYFSVDDKQV